MLLTETQIRQIIKEEIEAMVQEGELDEAFLDSIKKGIGRFAGKMASAAGATSADMADMEAATAKEKEKQAGFADAKKAAQQSAAYVKGVEKAASVITNKLASIDPDIDKLEEVVGYLKKMPGAGGSQAFFNADKVRQAADNLFKEVEAIVNGVKGSEYGSKGPTIKEKKNR
jgi:uncharacterized protein (DUF2164 family)